MTKRPYVLHTYDELVHLHLCKNRISDLVHLIYRFYKLELFLQLVNQQHSLDFLYGFHLYPTKPSQKILDVLHYHLSYILNKDYFSRNYALYLRFSNHHQV